jgi:hypothetical protein
MYMKIIIIIMSRVYSSLIDYYRYVNDVLIIINTNTTTIENTFIEFNSIHPSIKFTMEKEVHYTFN